MKIPLDLERTFERRWVARFFRTKPIDLKGHQWFEEPRKVLPDPVVEYPHKARIACSDEVFEVLMNKCSY